MTPSADDIREQIDVANEYVEEVTSDLAIPSVDFSALTEFLTVETEFIPPSHLSLAFTLLGGDLPQAQNNEQEGFLVKRETFPNEMEKVLSFLNEKRLYMMH